MINDLPLISVVITNYNYAQYLREAIESALNQTYQNIEIILIDDGSTDDSRKVYNEFSKKIRVIEHKQNRGIVYTRNEALREIKGDFLCFLDADDIWGENYLNKLVEDAKKSRSDVVYTDLQGFGDNAILQVLPEFSLDAIISRNIVDMGALIRVSSIGKHKFDEKLNRLSHEDWDFFLGLALGGKKFYKSHDVRLNYRIHANHRNDGNDLRKRTLNLLKVNSYIIEKYKKLYPKKIDFTEQNEIVSDVASYHSAIQKLKLVNDDQQNKIEELSRRIVVLKENIAERNNSIQIILNSRSYKIGLLCMLPIRWIKNFTKGKND